MKRIKKLGLAAFLTVVGASTLAACGETSSTSVIPSVDADLAIAEEAVSKVMFTQDGQEVAVDFKILSSVSVDGTSYTVEWSSSDTSVAQVVKDDDGNVTIDLQQVTAEEGVKVTLTATVTVNGKSASETFKITVLPQNEENYTVSSLKLAIKDIASSSDAIEVALNNVTVVASVSGSGIVADETGAMYVYGLTGVEIGDVVNITGKAYRYYNGPQIASPVVEKVSSGNTVNLTTTTKTVSELEALDITDINSFLPYYKVNAKIRVVTDANGSKNVLLTDPQDPTKFVVAYYKCSDVDYLAQLDGQTFDLKVALYDSYSNYNFGNATTEDGATIGTKTVKRVFYFDGLPEGAQINESAPVEMSLAEAKASEDGTKVIVTGVVKEINTAWSDKYMNITVTITDGVDDLYLFRLATNVAVGDKIEVTGEVGSYSGAKQIAAGATATVLASYPVKTIAEVLASEDNTLVAVSGTVKEINTAWSDQYKNITVTITDGTNELYVFRTITNVAVGDEVTFYGAVGSYNGAKQLAKNAIGVITKAASSEDGNDSDDSETGETTLISNPTVNLIEGKAEGESVTLENVTITAIDTANKIVFVANTTGSAGINLYNNDDVLASLAVGQVVNVTATVTKGTSSGLKNLLYLDSETITTGTGTAVSAPTVTQIDWSKDGYTWMKSLEADNIVGGYVEFTNVTFASVESSATGTNYSKFVTPESGSEYVGLYKCDPVEDDGTAVNTTDTYTVKCYIAGTNFNSSSSFNSDDVQSKIRLYAVSIVKQA